jgi:hypothetical protein
VECFALRILSLSTVGERLGDGLGELLGERFIRRFLSLSTVGERLGDGLGELLGVRLSDDAEQLSSARHSANTESNAPLGNSSDQHWERRATKMSHSVSSGLIHSALSLSTRARFPDYSREILRRRLLNQSEPVGLF